MNNKFSEIYYVIHHPVFSHVYELSFADASQTPTAMDAINFTQFGHCVILSMMTECQFDWMELIDKLNLSKYCIKYAQNDDFIKTKNLSKCVIMHLHRNNE